MTPSARSSSSRSQVVAPRLRVHARGRLVDEHDLRATDDGHRQPETLLLTAAEPPVRRPAAVAQPEPLGEHVDVERVCVQPGDVLEHLHRADTAPRAPGLEHHADPGQQRAPLADRVEPEHADACPAGAWR